MALLMNLEDFGLSQDASATSNVMQEEARIEAFENGYRAGWDDATKTAENEQKKMSAAFAQNLHDLSFTYHEARKHLLTALQPVFETMTAKVLPELAHQTLLHSVIEEILTIAQSHSEPPMEIRTHPDNLEHLKTLFPKDCALPLCLIPDSELSSGQVFLTHKAATKHINMDHTIEAIQQLTKNFFQLTQEEPVNDRTKHNTY